MFQVLVYVYENYWHGDAFPELPQLERKLNAIGFEADEVQAALTWLDGLNLAAKNTLEITAHAADRADVPTGISASTSMRVYSVEEQDRLGAACLGFVAFLESAGVLPPALREIVIDRAMAVTDDPMTLEGFKIIVLMVYWSCDEEPGALVLDELYDDGNARLPH